MNAQAAKPAKNALGAVLLLLAIAAVASAQRYGRLREGPSVPPRFPPPGFSDARSHIAR